MKIQFNENKNFEKPQKQSKNEIANLPDSFPELCKSFPEISCPFSEVSNLLTDVSE